MKPATLTTRGPTVLHEGEPLCEARDPQAAAFIVGRLGPVWDRVDLVSVVLAGVIGVVLGGCLAVFGGVV